jgi:hypothetical protein
MINLYGLNSHQAAQAICAHYDMLNLGIYIFVYDDMLEVCEQVSRQKTIFKKIDHDWVQQ